MVRVESWDVEQGLCTGMVTLRTVRACRPVKGLNAVGLALRTAPPAHSPTVALRLWLQMKTVTCESSGGRYGGLGRREHLNKSVSAPLRSLSSLCEEELKMS